MIEPDYARWRRPVFRYDSEAAFARVSAIKTGIHSIDFGGLPVDFLLQLKNSDTLLVVFGGAAPRGPDTTPPYYSGLGISGDLNCSVLCVNDPSLYLDDELRIGWYTGPRSLSLQRVLPPILDRVASLTSSRMIMAGGSGGGFASLYYGGKVQASAVSVAFNAQTNISKYNPGHLRRYASVCFGWKEGQDVESSYAGLIDFDLVSLFRPPPRSSVVYLQNADDWHVKVHAAPFLRNYGIEWDGRDQQKDGIYLHVGGWGSGHVPAPKPLLQGIIAFLCDWRGSWEDAVASPEMRSVFAISEASDRP